MDELLRTTRKQSFCEGYHAGFADGRLSTHGLSVIELRAALAEGERDVDELLTLMFGVGYGDD